MFHQQPTHPEKPGLDRLPRPALAVLGPNGSGKSTLMRLLAGDLRTALGGVVVGSPIPSLKTCGACGNGSAWSRPITRPPTAFRRASSGWSWRLFGWYRGQLQAPPGPGGQGPPLAGPLWARGKGRTGHNHPLLRPAAAGSPGQGSGHRTGDIAFGRIHRRPGLRLRKEFLGLIESRPPRAGP